MIVPRPLQSINLLSFLAKRASAESLERATHLNFYGKLAITSIRMMSTYDDGDGVPIDEGNNNNGRFWVHRPFQITPTTMSASVNPIIASCPLPKATPKSPPKDKFHNLYSSSPTPETILEQIHQSKVEFYESQFQARVAKEAETRIHRRTIQSPHGLDKDKVDATIYFPEKDDSQHDTPPKLRGICLHVHGGGWLFGDSYHQVAHRCLEMAQSMNVAVVSVEYSLFCQVNRYSNAFDPVTDVNIAINWIEANGPRELNTNPLYVASGESSGAHLLMLAMLKRRDGDNVTLHPPLPLPPKTSSLAPQSTSFSTNWKCLNLVYGVYDISGTPSIRTDGDSSSPLCGNDLLWMYELYYSKVQQSMQATNDNGAQQKIRNMERQHPSLSPLYANLSHMPPTLLSVGTADPLMDDTLILANRLGAFGNNVGLAIYEGGEHGIGHFGVQEDEEMGIRARKYTYEFMKEYL